MPPRKVEDHIFPSGYTHQEFEEEHIKDLSKYDFALRYGYKYGIAPQYNIQSSVFDRAPKAKKAVV